MINLHRIGPGTLTRTLAIGLASALLLTAGSVVESRSTDLWDDMAICFSGTVGASSGAEPEERRIAARRFMAENEAAMKRMMVAMAIAPTGDFDRDFVAMMVAHHQGAIDMAVTELRHGGNEQLRRIAQEIVVTQEQEIRAMRQAIGLADAAVESDRPAVGRQHSATLAEARLAGNRSQ